MRRTSLVLSLAAACVLPAGPELTDASPTPDSPPVELASVAPVAEVAAPFEAAPVAAPRLPVSDHAKELGKTIDTWFQGHGTRRLYAQIDRPMVRPGETVWVKSWSVASRGLARDPSNAWITYDLLDPRGQVVETKRVVQDQGAATNDFVIAPEAAGGKWTLRVTLPTGETDERPFVVASYSAPKIRKDLDFVRKAYGPGDRVEALVTMEAGHGGPLANHPVRALVTVGGDTLLDAPLSTDATGAVFVSADLPRGLASSDGLLTVFVDDGGVTESISRSVPIVLADARLELYPEGGDLVAGLPGRVYFAGKDRFGEPADIAGVVVDDRGQQVAEFRSVHDGLGRFAFTPKAGRTYTAKITSPVGVDATFPVPAAVASGCALRSFDDLNSDAKAVRVAVRCSALQRVTVMASLRDQVLDVATVDAGPTNDAVVFLTPDAAMARQQGAVRVTVFDHADQPLAERLVYRNPGRDLKVAITPDKEGYGPRDEVVLDVTTTDPSGAPVAAELALAVVDDTVLSLADDEEGHMLTRLYLEPELVDSPKDPGWYFDPKHDDAARGLDLVMGTKGWRRFEWHRVWEPDPVVVATVAREDWVEDDAMRLDMVAEMAMPVAEEAQRPMLRLPRLAAAKPMEVKAVEALPAPAAGAVAVHDLRLRAAADAPMGMAKREWRGDRDELGLEDLGYVRRQAGGWAPVRVFPKPDYKEGFTGVRTDFRDTVLWEPKVTTDASGKAQVRFYLSDAITTFRVTAEGLGGGYAGHGEATLASSLPVHVETTLPVAVSAGDRLFLPLTVKSARDRALSVDVNAAIDSEILVARDTSGALKLPANGGATWWVPVQVGAGAGKATVRLSAVGGGLTDTLEQSLDVVPAGFPRSWSAAGENDGSTRLVMQLDDVVQGSLKATVTWHPSTVATMITGMEGLIQTPGGCFEQTSSTNWPNVQILSYLEAHEGDPRLRMKSSQALDAGYAKLTGYQVQAGGFETWGSGPGKEALSAFGLLQFADMQKVYPVAKAVLSRDADYLLGQRDGKGGFTNSGESAHGYGSAPKPVLDGFITWSLVATGHGKQLDAEIAHQAEVARTTKDPYVLALAARSLNATGHPGAKDAIARLAALQDGDGSFPGAESSITRSYESNLLVESTALSALALIESGKYRPQADKAAEWLVGHRQGVGTWGATQATALALGALSAHAEANKRPRSAGDLEVVVNGRSVGHLAYSADEMAPLVVDGWQDALRKGENTIELRHPSGEALPFTVDVAWTAISPASAPGAELSLHTALDRSVAKMGETVRLTAKVGNTTDDVVPSPIARIGLPAGLEAQTWQLKQLQDRGEIAFFETRPREVVLYWDGAHKGETHEVALDLVARVPGEFTGPASSAWPYYDDDEKAWDAGLKVRIDRP